MWQRLIERLTGRSSVAAATPERTPVPPVDSGLPYPRSQAVFADRLAVAGLGAHTDALTQLVRPSARLLPDPSHADPESAPIRIGGRPALPAGAEWPRRADGRPLSLIAQIDLAQVAAVLEGSPFPRTGSLAFFYDAITQDAWGFRPEDRDAWRIVHCPSGELQFLEYPSDLRAGGRFAPVALSTEQEVTFPGPDSFEVEPILGANWWSTPYSDEVIGQEPAGDLHRFLGNPDPVQGDMQVEAQLASNGVYMGDETGQRSAEGQRLRPGSGEWRLLLQVDSNDAGAMMWGDTGRLYWWIKEADLRIGARDRAWLILQCS